MSLKIDVPKEKIAAFCLRWQVRELAIFGSALGVDFGLTAMWMYW